MKKLNNELQENNLFQKLQVFENNRINKDVDSIYQLLEDNFGSVGANLSVCGSVAKVMHGSLDENYRPKDVDLLVRNPFYYRFLQTNIQKLNVDFRIDDNRIILFFPNISVELWKHNQREKAVRTHGKFHNLINYCFI